MFTELKVITEDKFELHFVSIESYSEELLKVITSEIGKIWNGDLDGDDDIKIIKLELLELFKSKTGLQLHGLVSEFICHLYLRSIGFEQHFLFRNLEEKGMKKGFDGLYLVQNKYWLYESKSTLPTTMKSSHNDNVSEAYNDLKKKIEGKNAKNNPWKNAVSHANNRAVKENETLFKALKAFSSEYVQKKYHSISKFNVIPSSTIYLDTKWEIIDSSDLEFKLRSLIAKYNCLALTVLCINKKSINDFINFING